jgi:aryl-alcohol dehydrogenase-like predicted oxidoreductase
MGARLGLGLVAIGRPWPSGTAALPDAAQVTGLLEAALELGIALFDTARAYGASEDLLGGFLKRTGHRSPLPLVATKCGESWSARAGSSLDHRPAAIAESVRASVAKLGRIDVIQVHKATAENLSDEKLGRTLRSLAAELGIGHLGASVTDVPACDAALRAGLFDYLQCPVNLNSPDLAKWAREHAGDITIVANRPYGSGRLLGRGHSQEALLGYVLDHIGDGIVLTGTTNPDHLRQTHAIFAKLLGASGRTPAT